ncbi:trypsin-like serine peptidase [Solicola gregarius]|uniref:Trypsin-like serine protease n=1 Tax=Solicola gregarius TaxID=2908642 RepID=A0AA46TK40_9ACTN|nr:trypsin-like serine protease [Solicola gregarius]UYM06787.1 trypsin-like serine protease [Solicola gregarius]
MRLTQPTRGRRVRRVVAAAAAPALVAGIALPATMASASAPESEKRHTASADAVPYASQTVDLDSARAADAAYWTPKRMANAVPADRIARQAMQQQTPASRTAPAPTKSQSVAKAALPSAPEARKKTRKSKTVGKVFFTTRKGVDMVCSGAAVNSKRKNMVMTAGHCVHGGRGQGWHKNWIFVPGYGPGNTARHGVYGATSKVAMKGWIKHNNFNYDTALALVKPIKFTKKKLVKNVGGYGLQVGRSHKRRLAAVGYSQLGYKGDKQKSCRKRTRPAAGGNQIRLNCHNLTPGSSGGPWIKGKVRIGKKRHSALNGVVSNGPRRHPKHPKFIRSPYFDRNVKKMYNAYRNKKH